MFGIIGSDVNVTVEDDTAMIDVTIALDGDGYRCYDIKELENPDTGGVGAAWLIWATIVRAAVVAWFKLFILQIMCIRK